MNTTYKLLILVLAFDWALGCSPTPGTPQTAHGSAVTAANDNGSAGNQDPGGPPGINLDIQATGTPDYCTAGHYTGSFRGKYTSGATFIGIPIDVSGDVDLRLNQVATDSEFFAIQNGKVHGSANSSFPYECDMTGTLDCTSKELKDGFIECTYKVLVMTYKFSGPVTAEYDGSTQTLQNGTWSGKEPNMLPNMGGKGIWNAQYDGP